MIFRKILTGNIYEDLEVKAVCETGRWDSLKLLKIFEEKGKMGSLKALYRGRRLGGGGGNTPAQNNRKNISH